MRKRIALLVTALLLSSFYSPAMARSNSQTLVLHQAHNFDDVLSGSEDYFTEAFGENRARGSVQLKLEIPRSINDLTDESLSIPVALTVPGKGRFTGEVSGSFETVETDEGSSIYGYFNGYLTHGDQEKYVDLNITHDPSNGQTWAMLSFGYINDEDFSVVPFGTYHRLVVPTAQNHSRNSAGTQPDDKVQEKTTASSIGLMSYPRTQQPSYQSSATILQKCGGDYYNTGGMTTYGPQNVKGGASWAYGARVFSQTSTVWDLYQCKWPAIEFNNRPQVVEVVSQITLPIGFAISGDPRPEAQWLSGPYTVPVPYPSPAGGWDLTTIELPGKRISVTEITSSGSGWVNGIKHVWNGGNYAPDSDAEFGVPYSAQEERGFAHYALFSFQRQEEVRGTVSHYAKISYREPGILGYV